MFQSLADKLGATFDKLRGKGFLSEEDVTSALRDVRVALLEADVALPVVKQFTDAVKQKATGAEIVKSINPAQMVIKLVQDELVELLGGEDVPELSLNFQPPVTILMAGLQGSGKTTTTAKLAKLFKDKQKKKVLVASLDVYRPAAQQQLATVANAAGVDSLEIVPGEQPMKITLRALDTARKGAYDILLLDSAGRTHVDEDLMDELVSVAKAAETNHTILVVDSLTGQDAVQVAQNFKDALEPTGHGLTGVILTRADGDARGGAALSMKVVTGCPILYLGVGEKVSEIEPFNPKRVAGRILDMGDIVSLVERASEVINQEEASKLAAKMKKGSFDLNDLYKQLDSVKKMGGIGGVMGMMPGMGKIKAKMAENPVDDRIILRQQAIISSMTKKERRNPDMLNASRKKRIAAGAGVDVQQVNQLLKQFKQMQAMMKQLGKMGKGDMMKLMGKLGGMGGMQ